ncbi:MAG: hypothetical protein IPO38_06225 [Rhodocyclaceae bacterium]|nr:hypothetical protein [Rhodocyclaceae bacterium]
MSAWLKLCPIEEIPRWQSRHAARESTEHRDFRSSDDVIFAVGRRLPTQRRAAIARHHAWQQVTCPLHAWKH